MYTYFAHAKQPGASGPAAKASWDPLPGGGGALSSRPSHGPAPLSPNAPPPGRRCLLPVCLQAGLVLALLGGVRKSAGGSAGGGGGLALRGDIHVLMVGDPGVGKTQLLKVSEGGGAFTC